jgi:hypothetical protein
MTKRHHSKVLVKTSKAVTNRCLRHHKLNEGANLHQVGLPVQSICEAIGIHHANQNNWWHDHGQEGGLDSTSN